MISALLPTIRPDNVPHTINSMLVGAPDDLEILVMADFKPNFKLDKKVRWFIESERNGVVSALNDLHTVAKGDFYFSLNDESQISGYHLGMMEEYYKGRLVVGSPRQIPDFPFFYYKKQFAAFPFVSRETLTAICDNKWFMDPVYGSFFADPDLSMQAWEKGIPVEICHNAELYHNNNDGAEGHFRNVMLQLPKDKETFQERWKHLGEFVEPTSENH
jgi:hypothetical protein